MLLVWVALISAPLAAAPILDADFDDKTADAPIGTGGPAVGEPISVHANVDAIVRSTPFATNALELTHDAMTSAGTVRFEFLGSAEISTCKLEISGKFWFDLFEPSYTLRVREQSTAGSSFLNLIFDGDGDVNYSDEDSPTTVDLADFVADAEVDFVVTFDLTAGTYDLTVGGVQLLDDETHGVTGDGVGAVLVGFINTVPVGPFWLDDLLVEDFGGLLCASFEGGSTGEWSFTQP